jgi:hypothetical protein
MDDADVVEDVDPDEAFSTLADSSRLAILRALWRAEDQEATFSELRDAIEMRDSGRFNYHLGKLTDRFVRATDDGYRLEPAGRYVVGALIAGAYTRSDPVGPTPLDEPCPACGGDRTFQYDGAVRIDCEDCDLSTYFDAPPGIFAGREPATYPRAAERYARTLVAQAGNGFCPYCRGPVEAAVVPAPETADGETATPDRFADVAMVRYDCERCGESTLIDAGTALLDHPAVVAFYRDHGVDVREASLWRFSALTPERSTIADRDPLRATVSFPADGDRLTVTVDDSLTPLSIDR